MEIEWQENEDKTEASATVGELEMLISLYTEDLPCRGMWHWQTHIQQAHRAVVTGIARTREEAIKEALGWVGKGADAIRAAAVKELRDQIYVAMMIVAEIDPVAPFEFPVFEAGYNSGLAAARGALDGLWTAQFGHAQAPQFLEDDGPADEVVKH